METKEKQVNLIYSKESKRPTNQPGNKRKEQSSAIESNRPRNAEEKEKYMSFGPVKGNPEAEAKKPERNFEKTSQGNSKGFEKKEQNGYNQKLVSRRSNEEAQEKDK